MKSRINDDFSNQMIRIEDLLDTFTERYAASRSTNVAQLNKLLYVYSASKSKFYFGGKSFGCIWNGWRLILVPRRSAMFNKLIKSIEEGASGDDLVLSSRMIRDVVNNLNKLNYMVPEICEKILRYLYENRKKVCGEIVGRALYTFYTLGYEPAAHTCLPGYEQSTQQLPQQLPQQQPIRFYDFGAIIERDFELMPGLTIVRACLALVYYRALSMELIEKVFNLDFLMRLESEISICYANVRPAPYFPTRYTKLVYLGPIRNYDFFDCRHHIHLDH